jgi:tetratricopeptide (TPR) repeat protein
MNYTPLKYSIAVFFLWLCGMLNCVAQSEKKLTREGNRYFKKEKYGEAEVAYRKALEKNKKMPEAQFNLGDAVYEQKRFEEAAKQFELSAKISTNRNIQAKALHNLGNSYLSQQKYKEAAEAFKSSLKLNPKDEDTRYNLAYANAMLQQQQQQQQQKNQDKKDDKNQQENQKDRQNQQDKKNQDKNQSNQQPQQNKQEQQQQPAQRPKLNKEEAEKLLQVLQNEEQKANQKMQKAQAIPVKIKVEKDW